MKPYVIKQGDYLIKLAHILSFDADEVWNHGKNAELKRKRTNHNVLVPGDILYIPEDPPKKNRFTAASTNTFAAFVPRIAVKVAMNMAGKPMKGETYVVRGIGEDEKEKTTDAQGNVEFQASVHVRDVEVHFPKRNLTRTIAVGGLDPIEEPSGLKMRLTHLGFYTAQPAPGGGYPGRDDNRLEAAVFAFQTANQLPATGECDDATKAAILAAHGS
jgi:Putative peptidoglycan binding domain